MATTAPYIATLNITQAAVRFAADADEFEKIVRWELEDVVTRALAWYEAQVAA